MLQGFHEIGGGEFFEVEVGAVAAVVCESARGGRCLIFVFVLGVGTALMQAAVDMADHWLDLLRLELGVFVDNEPAVRLYQRFGFVIEGTLTRYAFRAGTYADVYAMARFRQG